MAPSASKLTEQNVRVIVIGVSVRARTIPSRPQMFCWGVYIWEGPDVCRTYSEKQADVASGTEATSATGPAIRQRFTELRLPKGHHDEPPEPDWFRPLPNNYKFGNGDEQNDGF